MIRFPKTAALLSCVLLSACGEKPLDGEVGTSTFRIDNTTDHEIFYEYDAGAIAEIQVLAETIPANSAEDIILSSGCFGCWDHPEDVFASLRIISADEDVLLTIDPMTDEAWDLEKTDSYSAVYTLTVSALPLDD